MLFVVLKSMTGAETFEIIIQIAAVPLLFVVTFFFLIFFFNVEMYQTETFRE